MNARKSRFIDDEAEEDTEPNEEDSDLDDISVTTDIAAAEDEDFIVQVVKRRFGIVELDSGAGLQENKFIQAQPAPLVGLRTNCCVGYNSDCSKPVVKSGDPLGSGQLGDVKNPVVIGSGYSGPSTTPSGSRRKKLPKTAQQSVVPSSISERANSQRKAALPNNSSEVPANAISAVRQETTAMDTETTAL